MDKIKGVSLKELVGEVAKNVVDEKRKGAAGQIKKIFYQVYGLTKEIKALEKERDKKEQALEKAQGKIEKLKAGDWSILQDETRKESPNNR